MIEVQRLGLAFVFLGASVFPLCGQVKPVKIADSGGGVSIAINGRNPNNIIASVGNDRVTYSLDKGATWTEAQVVSAAGFSGAPVVSADERGELFFIHASDSKEKKHLVSHGSKDGGKTWDPGTPFGPLLTTSIVSDVRVVRDARGNQSVTWTQRDGADTECHSHIYRSVSGNGKKWSAPLQLSQENGGCTDDNLLPLSALTGMSADGKVYAAWSWRNKIFIDRSFDGGGMWLNTDLPIADQFGGHDLDIPGHGICRNNAVIAVDATKSVHKGMMYLTWADKRQGDKGTDVWFIRSSNHGDNWTTPIRINTDAAGHHHYQPWMVVDQSTGNIYIVYYDRSAYDDTRTDVYLAYSTDTGSSFKKVKISETPFTATPVEGVVIQTYLAAHKGIVTPAWISTEKGKASVWMAVIEAAALGK